MNVRLTRVVVSGVTAVALAATAAIGALATVMDAGTRNGSLVQVGPIAEHGFPAWYRDSNGVRLEACTTLDDPLCSTLPDEVPNPDEPVSYPGNFPGEFFYQLAGADLTVQGADLRVVMDLEGAWAAEEVRPGDQMVFGRIRIRAKDAPDGVTWRITHPYGVDQFTTSGGSGINMTEDIGITPGAFGGALKSRIGPFLKWNPAIAPAAPAGYTGDPGVDHQVVGSPYNTNYVKVEQVDASGNRTEIARTDLFSVQGRYASNSGVDVDKAVYRSGTDGKGFVEVYASSEVGQSIVVDANPALHSATTPLRGQDGRYYARIATTGNVAPGTKISVSNISDKPVTTKAVELSDDVTVSQAAYDADRNELRVSATSSDALVDADVPALTVPGFGALTNGTATFGDVLAPPASVTVTSTRGGSTPSALSTSGAGFVAGLPVAGFVATDQAQVGQPVALDGTASTGDITSYDWQVSGPGSTTVTGQGGAQATFTPSATGTYTITLKVTGPGGTSLPMSRTLTVTAPVGVRANAGPDQTVQRGLRVTLNASASSGQTSLRWTQVSGPTATLSSATATSPTFTYPLMKLPVGPTAHVNTGYAVDNAPLVFRVTATAANGTTATDEVTVAPLAETFTGLTARYRTRGEWRVSGTSSIKAAQKVVMVLGSSPAGAYIGEGSTDATGAFSFKGGGTPLPAAGTSTVTFVSATGGSQVATLQVTN
jgi:hypothetical protein